MKRSQLKQIIKEIILEDKGYSNFVPGKETSGLDKKTLDNILLRIAKGERPSEEEHSAARGNRILDKADPENVKRILGGDEVGRMQELAGLKQEIKVNNPNRLSFDYEEDDDDGELKIISISKDGETWYGNEPYLEQPGIINIEFLFEGGDDDGIEQEMMDKLVSLLKKTNTKFKEVDVNNDGELIYIQIPKDSLNLI